MHLNFQTHRTFTSFNVLEQAWKDLELEANFGRRVSWLSMGDTSLFGQEKHWIVSKNEPRTRSIEWVCPTRLPVCFRRTDVARIDQEPNNDTVEVSRSRHIVVTANR
jgi:hypothetical protein